MTIQATSEIVPAIKIGQDGLMTEAGWAKSWPASTTWCLRNFTKRRSNFLFLRVFCCSQSVTLGFMVVMTPRDRWADERLDEAFNRLDGELKGLRGEVNARFDKVDTRFDKMEASFHALNRVLLGSAAAIIAALIGLIGVSAF
jgi:hypothetical protein